METAEYDAVIVGGGPIGCAAAIALSNTGMNVVVLESLAIDQRPNDSRTLALSWNSRLVLERLEAWPACPGTTPIKTIHVSHRGRFGRAELSAVDAGLPALGYVLGQKDVHQALRNRVDSCQIEYRNGFLVSNICTDDAVATVSGIADNVERLIQAKLVVVADGGSQLTKSLSKVIHQHDYGQSAVVGLVQPDCAHEFRAYERFTPSGPIALLPFENEFALVWTCKPAQVPSLLDAADGKFLDQLQVAFGDRAGRFIGVRERASFPLMLRVARERSSERLVLLGNAAQTLHPIAGQGFNLGLRDTWDLAETVHSHTPEQIGNHAMTASFHNLRRADRVGGIVITDMLAKLFSNDLGPLSIGRGFALALLDALPPIKRGLMLSMIFGLGR